MPRHVGSWPYVYLVVWAYVRAGAELHNTSDFSNIIALIKFTHHPPLTPGKRGARRDSPAQPRATLKGR